MADPQSELAKFDAILQSKTGGAPVQAAQSPAQMSGNIPFAPNAPLSMTPKTDAVMELQRFDEIFKGKTGDAPSINTVPREVGVRALLNFQEQYGRKNEDGTRIPIDIKRGLPLAEYMAIAQQRGPQAQLEAVKQLYPDRNARILDSGDITIELLDSETGKPKDVMINPVGIGAEDLVDLTAQAPEIAAGVAAAVATRGTGVMRTLGQIILSSLAASGTGAVKDAAVRSTTGVELRPGEIALARGGEAALDMFVQGGLAAGAKVFGKAVSPFANDIKYGSLEFDARKGQQFFKETFGEDIKLTPAEVTGSRALSAVEALESKQPGARSVFQKVLDKRNEAVARIQARALGQVTPNEVIGEEAIGQIQREISAPLENALQAARTAAERKGNQRIIQALDDAAGIPRVGEPKNFVRITPTEAGGSTLEAFDAKVADAQSKVNEAYNKVRAIPGGEGDVLDGTAAADAAARLRKELPQAEKLVETESALVDELGRPMKSQGTEREILESGVPAGLMKFLDDLEGLRGAKVSLQTLTNMRKSAYDAISTFRTATGGTKDRWFTKVADAYEEAIEGGLDSIGDDALKDALRTAKDTYKRELLPLERPGVKELAKDEFDGGRLSPEQVMDRLFEGPKSIENYRLLKETLGETNPVFKTLKRAWADTQLEKITDPVTGAIDVDVFQRTLRTMHTERPELAKELFGPNSKGLIVDLEIQKKLQNIKNLDASEVKSILALKNPSSEDFATVLKAQRNRDTAYVNSIIRDIGDGVAVEQKLKPTEFVRRLANTDTPTEEVEVVLGFLAKKNPEMREAIATSTLYRILDEASERQASTAAKQIRGEPLELNPSRLAEAFGRPGTPERIRNEILLGDSILPVTPPGVKPPRLKQQKPSTREDAIENLIKVLAPSGAASDVFAGAGGMVGGAAVNNVHKKPLKYAKTFVQKMVLATFYTSEIGRKYAANRVLTNEETAALGNILIASEPFVRRVVDVLGEEDAQQVIIEAKSSIDQYVNDTLNSSKAYRATQEIRKFLQGEPSAMQVE